MNTALNHLVENLSIADLTQKRKEIIPEEVNSHNCGQK